MRADRSLIFGFCLFLAFFATPSFGQSSDSSGSTALADPALELQAKTLEQMIISPCCWTQPVSDHYSGISWEIRDEIRAQLAEGKTQQEILESYMVEYGRRILASPENSGFDSLAYYLPFVFLFAGAGLCYYVVRKLRNRPAQVEASSAPAKIDSRYSQLLERELSE